MNNRANVITPDGLVKALQYIAKHNTPDLKWNVPSTLFIQMTEMDGKIRADISAEIAQTILQIYTQDLKLKLSDTLKAELEEKCRHNNEFKAKCFHLINPHQTAPNSENIPTPS